MDLSINEQHQITKLSNLMHSLLALDQVWTRSLPPVAAPVASVEARASLAAVGQEIEQQWRDLGKQAAVVEQILERRAPDLDRELPARLAQLPLSKEQLDAFTAYVNRQGGYGNATKQAMDEIRRSAATERNDVRAKLAALGKGGEVRGDMSKRAECGILFGAAILLTLTAVAPLAAAGIGGFIARGCVAQ